MVFSSIVFLFYFFPLFFALYYLLPWKNAVLLVASLVFYAWGEPRFVLLLLASACLNYGFGYAIARAGRGRRATALLAAGVGINLLILFYYKYLAFFMGAALALAGVDPAGRLPEIVLPLGISFFTFQGISYLVDVHRGEVDAQKSLAEFAMYKAMFPQLIAGPIVRYKDVAREIAHRRITAREAGLGFQIFVLGLAQKVLIANTVAVAADRTFAVDPSQLSALHAWLGILAYSVQIFFDFAGYSAMAIGMGFMLGFKYPPNFNWPYTARTVTDFWRRWHISLSTWFRDYLYIPLGGNRVSPARTYANLAIVFLLCGLWHGAAWTFIVWGAWHGALLIVERTPWGRVLASAPAAVGRFYTLVAVMVGWVFFRANDLPHAFRYLGAMFLPQPGAAGTQPWQASFDTTSLAALAIGLAIALWPWKTWHLPVQAQGLQLTALRNAVSAGWVCVLLLACVASLAAGTYNPFIYFRF